MGFVRALGLMSGTSLDGIDAAILETDGEAYLKPVKTASFPYLPEERAFLRLALDVAADWGGKGLMPEEIAEAERAVTYAHAMAVRKMLEMAGMEAKEIDVIGFHGQTVLHRPEEGITVQLGLGEVLADLTGIDVVNDFRAADVAAGGQGAPFAPLYHRALAAGLHADGPITVVNIGGVGNVTFIGSDKKLLAFDTGPGNALIDDWAFTHTETPIDKDGALARAGSVDEKVLERLLTNLYFARTPPKSLDRLDFSADYAEGLSVEDGAATLTAFTAASIAKAMEHMPEEPRLWVVCGGGRHNPALMDELKARLPGAVIGAEDAGWRGDDVEAEAFAYLAVRSLRGLPLSEPGTTGVPEALTGGVLNRAKRARG
ncbi:anhydro-N-acetylmuramic acid kinase [Tepidicaulis sp.]|uniref:anhydro-N-acetylmuramic acid kinase n=1 Tax=Tepidicaulis sp. TaxID=1920809 RepID=UPI003B595E47